MRAAAKGDEAAVAAQLSAGADPNFQDEGTPLSEAAAAGHVEIVRMLIQAGAKVDRRESEGYFNPALRAAYRSDVAVLEVLVAAGANLAVEIEGVGTPLDYAYLGRVEGNDGRIRMGNSWDETIAYLEKVGAPRSSCSWESC